MTGCCDLENFDFKLDGQSWKKSYAKPTCSCVSPAALVGLRVSIALVWLTCCIWSFSDWANYAPLKYWFTKLTHWGAVLELVYFFFASFTTYKAVYGSDEDGTGDATPWYVRATWFLNAVTPCAALIVVSLFWALVYDGSALEALNVVMHGGNFLLVIVDFLLVRQPFYYSHVYMPVVFGGTYALFTLVYYLAGGTFEDGESPYIYSAVDWSSNAKGTGNLLGLIVLLGVPVLYTTLFCLFVHPCCRSKVSTTESTMV